MTEIMLTSRSAPRVVGILTNRHTAESAAGTDVDVDDGIGFASSPASVIARSLLLFFPTPESAPASAVISFGWGSSNLRGGAEPIPSQLDIVVDALRPPVNSTNNSAHAHEIR